MRMFHGTHHHEGVPDLQRKDDLHQDACHECYGWYLWARSLLVFLHSSFSPPRRVLRDMELEQREVEGVCRVPCGGPSNSITHWCSSFLLFFPVCRRWLGDTVPPTIAELA
jgi:hypothetical protein